VNTLNISRHVGLIDLFKEKGFKIGVEVGTDMGGYAKAICKRATEIELYTIDPWKAFKSGLEDYSQFEMGEREKIARDLLAPYPLCTIIKNTSMEAIKAFRPNQIDFVFIDGNHEYEAVKEDIEEWTKVVKPGGIVCGHDYVKDDSRKYGVIEAVNEYAEKNNIELSVLKKGTFVDCWLFYKPL